MRLSSPAFGSQDAIPTKYTCEGRNVSPALEWSDVPAGTKSLALVVEDPDAPDPAAPKRIWCHWILYGLPPDTTGLAEGVASHALPKGTMEGLNDSRESGYDGPCPPIGTHRYFFRLYALDTVLPDLGRPNREQILSAMKDHVLATAELMGTYQQSRR